MICWSVRRARGVPGSSMASTCCSTCTWVRLASRSPSPRATARRRSASQSSRLESAGGNRPSAGSGSPTRRSITRAASIAVSWPLSSSAASASRQAGPPTPGSRPRARSRRRRAAAGTRPIGSAAPSAPGSTRRSSRAASWCTSTGAVATSRNRPSTWWWARSREGSTAPIAGRPRRCSARSSTSVSLEARTVTESSCPAGSAARKRAATSAAVHSSCASTTVTCGAPPLAAGTIVQRTPERSSSASSCGHIPGRACGSSCSASSSMPSGQVAASPSSSAITSARSSAGQGARVPVTPTSAARSRSRRAASRSGRGPWAAAGSHPVSTAASRQCSSCRAVLHGSTAKERAGQNGADAAARCSSIRRRYCATRTAGSTAGRVRPSRFCSSCTRARGPIRAVPCAPVPSAQAAPSRDQPNSIRMRGLLHRRSQARAGLRSHPRGGGRRSRRGTRSQR